MGAIRVIQAFTTERRRAPALRQLEPREPLGEPPPLHVPDRVRRVRQRAHRRGARPLVLWIGARHVMSGTLTVGELLVFTSYLASLYAPDQQPDADLGPDPGRARRRRARLRDPRDGARSARRPADADARRGARGDRVRARALRLRAGPAGAARHRPPRARRRAGGDRRRDGRRQDDAREPGRRASTTRRRAACSSTGVDVREFRLRALRQPGRAWCSSRRSSSRRTIRENIAYGRPDATPAEIDRRRRLAQLDELRRAAAGGSRHVVGEGGATLSAGEQLRITIARAILRDAPILILDEPTAALDATTEALGHAGRSRSSRRAGRPSSSRTGCRRSAGADGSSSSSQGRIVEQGTFAELVARGGPLRALCTRRSSVEEAPHAASSVSRSLVLGLVGQYPMAGVAWQAIHYLVGLRAARLRGLLRRGLRGGALRPAERRADRRLTRTAGRATSHDMMRRIGPRGSLGLPSTWRRGETYGPDGHRALRDALPRRRASS